MSCASRMARPYGIRSRWTMIGGSVLGMTTAAAKVAAVCGTIRRSSSPCLRWTWQSIGESRTISSTIGNTSRPTLDTSAGRRERIRLHPDHLPAVELVGGGPLERGRLEARVELVPEVDQH